MQLTKDQASSKTLARADVRGNCLVRVLRTAEEVEGIRDFWTSFPGTRDSDIDLLLSECGTGSDGRRPYALVLYRDEKPVALISASLVRRRLMLGVGYLGLFTPLANVMDITRGGLRGEELTENCALLVWEITNSLKSGEADVAVFGHLDTTSELFRCARRVPSFLCRDHYPTAKPSRARILPESVEQLYGELSKSERKDFRRFARALERDFPGQVSIEQFGSAADLDRVLQVVDEIASTTWQRKLGRGFQLSPGMVVKLRAEAERGWLRVYILRLGGKPCAFWVGVLYQSVFYADSTGYDPQYAQYSPGFYLLSRMMEEFCASNISVIDFSWGNEEYKKRFGNRVQQVTTLHVFAPSFKGLRLAAMNATATAIRGLARWLINRSGLTQKIQRIWRQALVARGTARSSGTGEARGPTG